ncbi:MAG: histidinol-phosphatase, partial [Persephonella sp.]
MIVIFDVDGVIFETSKSYHLTIVETVKFYTGKEGINKDEI